MLLHVEYSLASVTPADNQHHRQQVDHLMQLVDRYELSNKLYNFKKTEMLSHLSLSHRRKMCSMCII